VKIGLVQLSNSGRLSARAGRYSTAGVGLVCASCSALGSTSITFRKVNGALCRQLTRAATDVDGQIVVVCAPCKIGDESLGEEVAALRRKMDAVLPAIVQGMMLDQSVFCLEGNRPDNGPLR
jgi:hypothetical protein